MGSINDDRTHIMTTLDSLHSQQRVMIDANGGWDRKTASKLVSEFSDPRIIWEEPCKTLEANLELANSLQGTFMLDQCVGESGAAQKALSHGGFHGICIKPAPLGGLSKALDIREKAISAGMQVRIDGPWCGDIASTAILHLASTTPAEALICGCDLTEPLVIEPKLSKVNQDDLGRIYPPAESGLGIDDPGKILGKPEVVIV